MHKLSKRGALLGLALLVSICASVWTYWRANGDKEVEAITTESVVRTDGEDLKKSSGGDYVLLRQLAPVMKKAPVNDLFEVKNWNEPPPTPPDPPQAQAQPAPVAPPLPFQFFGKTEVAGEPGTVLIHLINENNIYSVRPGENIDENYKLEKIEEDVLLIDYLPLDTKQTLFIGKK